MVVLSVSENDGYYDDDDDDGDIWGERKFEAFGELEPTIFQLNYLADQ